MTHHHRKPLLVTACCLLALARCADSAGPVDGAVAEAELGLSDGGLARCSTPKTYCTPANTCGLKPTCSASLVCETSGLRDCDDGVACTQDRCVHGGCGHVVLKDTCLIDGVCYKKGQVQGCGRCAPELKQRSWSLLDGVSCDDKNSCTKGDLCRDGACVGQAYNCSDNLPCTTDSCDGLGGCSHFLDPMYCQIEKSCSKHLETDASGCKICNVSVSQSAWQTRTSVCTIDGKCYGAGDKDSTGCFLCDLHQGTQWTPASDRCLIGQLCLLKGVIHPSQCAICDPDKTTKQWTPISGATLAVTTFTEGLSGYSTTPKVGGVGWALSSARSTSAPQSLYYGDPKAKSYDNGSTNSGLATSAAVSLTASQKAYLTFQLFMDTEKTDNYDVLAVQVDGQDVWVKDAKSMTQADYGNWKQVTVDISAFAGKSVKIGFSFDTKDALNNTSEGVYVDDVTLLAGCGSNP